MKRMKLRNKVFIYILVFTSIIIALLWVFQIVFLDDFYKSIKSTQVEKASETIALKVEEGDREQLNEALLNTYSDYCIRIIRVYEIEATPSFEYQFSGGLCSLLNEYGRYDELDSLFQKTLVNKDFAKEIRTTEGIGAYQSFDTINIGRIVRLSDGTDYFVITSARITPVVETVETLKLQLIIITSIVVLLGLIIAFIISMHIARPIHKTNKQAKLLGKGDLKVHFDATGYVEIEELNDTLNYAVNELSKVETMRNELIANMSHDLRTPLTMIGGYSEVIRDLPGEDTKENIQVIIDETKRLTNLVNNILDLSKLQSANEELNLQTYNISEQIQSIVSRFNVLLTNDGYEIIFECKEAIFVRADESKIDQVIYNILGNAIHYTGQDKKVYITLEKQENKVRIAIRDTGKGIKEEDIPLVWDRYYKLKTTHKRQQIGTGLGLSIVRGILELHNVEYGIVSEKGKGATFYFDLFVIEEIEK